LLIWYGVHWVYCWWNLKFGVDFWVCSFKCLFVLGLYVRVLSLMIYL